MMQANSSNFKIYNASAGSGKTFTLVKEYLTTLLASKHTDYYKHLLAITFTNKAVAEMKTRIVQTLFEFSKEEIFNEPSVLFTIILEETGLSPEELHKKSAAILKHILHHYEAFSVETIDGFNHRLIRTFAKDLKISQNFEVSLEQNELLAEAVDQLIDKAGEDQEITKVLLNFALQKTDEDKSWDIARDIANTSKILFNENEAEHLAKLKEKPLALFKIFEDKLRQEILYLTSKIVDEADSMLTLFQSHGLDENHFSGKYLYTFYVKLANEIFDQNYDTAWQRNMGVKPLYPSRIQGAEAELIDAITPQIIASFASIKADVYRLFLLQNVLKNLVPLSVINLVMLEIENIKEEQNIVPVSEFNSIISKEIKGQPVPFIYERLGDKYRHFFIDEFQDTSQMQWQNLQPLIDNALTQQNDEGIRGSLLLVGDAKQSIYRWRGGLPEQFINLNGDYNPFPSVEKSILNLETNWRSYDAIIYFNNGFFQHIAQFFESPLHEELFTIGNQQKDNHKKGGFVQVEFIESANKEEAHEIYGEKVFETISSLKEKGLTEKDICVLTRTRKDGIELGNFLSEKNIPIISSETLLLNASKVVRGLIETLRFALTPSNLNAKMGVLHFLYEQFDVEDDSHSFFSELIPLPLPEFSKRLMDFSMLLNFQKIIALPLYEAFEYIIQQTQLAHKKDGYLFGFMDLVFDYSQQPHTGKNGFLEFWETKKETAAISSSQNAGAVRLMTIHQSKGLEFPVVIFPYADVDILREIDPKTWFEWEEEGSGFDEVLISYKSEVANYGERGVEICNTRNCMLQLDNLNLLYVTLTRAVEQLYIFSEKPKKSVSLPRKYNEFFRNYLEQQQRWNDNQLVYNFGNSEKVSKEKTLQHNTEEIAFVSSAKENHELTVIGREGIHWNEERRKAVLFGDTLHNIMSKIVTKDDVEVVFDSLKSRGVLAASDIEELKKTVENIVNHKELSEYFSSNHTVFIERDFVIGDHHLLRPDRVNFIAEKEAIIIDYKTGTAEEKHKLQIIDYAEGLQQMGFVVSKLMLVYCKSDEVTILNV